MYSTANTRESALNSTLVAQRTRNVDRNCDDGNKSRKINKRYKDGVQIGESINYVEPTPVKKPNYWLPILIGGVGAGVCSAGWYYYNNYLSNKNRKHILYYGSFAGSTLIFLPNTCVEATMNDNKILFILNTFNANMEPVSSNNLTVNCSETIYASTKYNNLHIMLVDGLSWNKNSFITISSTDKQYEDKFNKYDNTLKLDYIPLKCNLNIPRTNSIFDQISYISKYSCPLVNMVLCTEKDMYSKVDPLFGYPEPTNTSFNLNQTYTSDTLQDIFIYKPIKIPSNKYDFFIYQAPPNNISRYFIGFDEFTVDPKQNTHQEITISYRNQYNPNSYKIQAIPADILQRERTNIIISLEPLHIYSDGFILVNNITEKHVANYYTYMFTPSETAKRIFCIGDTTRKSFMVTNKFKLSFTNSFVKYGLSPIFFHLNESLNKLMYVFINSDGDIDMSKKPVNVKLRQRFDLITPSFSSPFYYINENNNQGWTQLTWDDTVPLWSNSDYANMDMLISTRGDARYCLPNGYTTFFVKFKVAEVKTLLDNAKIDDYYGDDGNTNTNSENGVYSYSVHFKNTRYKECSDIIEFIGTNKESAKYLVNFRDTGLETNLIANVDKESYVVTLSTPICSDAYLNNTEKVNVVKLRDNCYIAIFNLIDQLNIKYTSVKFEKVYPTLYFLTNFFVDYPQDSNCTRIYMMHTIKSNGLDNKYTTSTGINTFLFNVFYSSKGVVLDIVSTECNNLEINPSNTNEDSLDYYSDLDYTRSSLIFKLKYYTQMNIFLLSAPNKSDKVVDTAGKFITYKYKKPFLIPNYDDYFKCIPYIAESEEVNMYFDLNYQREGNCPYPRNTMFFITPNKSTRLDFYLDYKIDVKYRFFKVSNIKNAEDVLIQNHEFDVTGNQLIFTNENSAIYDDTYCYGDDYFIIPMFKNILMTSLMHRYNPNITEFNSYIYNLVQTRFANSVNLSALSSIFLFPPVFTQSTLQTVVLKLIRYTEDMKYNDYTPEHPENITFSVVDNNYNSFDLTNVNIKVLDNFIIFTFKINRISSDITNLKLFAYVPDIFVVDIPVSSSITFKDSKVTKVVKLTKKIYNLETTYTYLNATVDTGSLQITIDDDNLVKSPNNLGLIQKVYSCGLTLLDNYVQVSTSCACLIYLEFSPSKILTDNNISLKYIYDDKYKVLGIPDEGYKPLYIDVIGYGSNKKRIYFHYRKAHRGKNELCIYKDNANFVFMHPTWNYLSRPVINAYDQDNRGVKLKINNMLNICENYNKKFSYTLTITVLTDVYKGFIPKSEFA